MGSLFPPWGDHPTHFLYFGGRFIDKTVPGSSSGDGSQWAGLNTAIESYDKATRRRCHGLQALLGSAEADDSATGLLHRYIYIYNYTYFNTYACGRVSSLN